MKLTFWVYLLLTLPRLVAAPTSDEKAEAKVALQAFQDGTFTLAQTRASAFLKKYPSSELAPQVRLTEAQAQYQLGRNEDALATLNVPEAQIPAPLKSDYLFWQAESLLDLDKWPEAESKYRALLLIKDNNAHLEAANLGLAWTLFKQNREADGLGLLQNLMTNHGDSPAGMEARLLTAKIAIAKGQFDDASKTLEALLVLHPPSRLIFETSYWLGESYNASGKLDLAATAYETITKNPQAFPKLLVAQAQLGLGQVRHKLNEDDKALPCYEAAYKLTENETVRLSAFKAYLQSARKSQQLPDAITKLQDFVKSVDSARPGALFAIAFALAEDHSDDNKAIGILDTLLVTYDTTSWRGSAQDLLGQLYVRTKQPEQAIRAFQACLETSKDPALLRDASFNLGLILYQQGKFAEAASQFDKVTSGQTDALAQSAAYNLILVQTALHQPDATAKLVLDFDKRFPHSSYRSDIAIAQGDLLASQGKNEDALAAYQAALQPNGKDPSQLNLQNHLANFYYQTNQLEAAVKAYQQIVDNFPETSLEAAQRGLLARYEAKKINDDQFEQALLALTQKYGKSPEVAEVYFRLGEFYFYRRNYVNAQSTLQQLASTYPDSPYADDAYFFAGRAAAAHQDYASAQTLLGKIPNPSPFKSDGLLWQAWVFHQQQKFESALSLYNAVLGSQKSGHSFIEANLGKGECLFEMGARDPASYGLAADAFSQILASKEGTVAQRNEAAVRKASCLAKLNKTDDALGLFMDVLYGRVAGNEQAPEQAPDFNWQIQGGWEAEHIMETQKNWRGAIEIYKRLEQIGGIYQQKFRDSINKLRRDNYIYD